MPGIGWDDPFVDDMKIEWISYFTEMIKMSNVVFNRSIKPKGSIRKPDLILFSDASTEEFPHKNVCPAK